MLLQTKMPRYKTALKSSVLYSRNATITVLLPNYDSPATHPSNWYQAKAADLAYKDVASRTEWLGSSGTQGAPHDKGNFVDDTLHDAHVVQHGDHTAEEHHHWQHL